MLLQSFKLPWPNPEFHGAARQQNSDRLSAGRTAQGSLQCVQQRGGSPPIPAVPLCLAPPSWSQEGGPLRALTYPASKVGELAPLCPGVTRGQASSAASEPTEATLGPSLTQHQFTGASDNLQCLLPFPVHPSHPGSGPPLAQVLLLLILQDSPSLARLPDAPAQSRLVTSSSPGAHAPWWHYHR